MKKYVYFLFTCIILNFFIVPIFCQESAPALAPEKGAVSAPAEKSVEAPKVEAKIAEGEQGLEGGLEWGTPQVVSRNLSRFGSGFFRMSASTFAPISDVPVGPEYVLGPGDELIIDVWGMIEGRYQVIIDREGGVVLPKIGRLHLWGLTFNNAEKLIRQKFNKYFTGFELSITMGRLRTIKVFVLGEVRNPGSYELSSLSTLFHALYTAGGPTSTGTMRNIQLIRNNEIIGTTDIYDFLLTGKKQQDYKLQSGDTIFIPLVGPLVGISGNIKRPAIYELKEEKRILDLINLAGGISITGYSGRIQVERVEKYEKKLAFDLENVIDLFEGKDGKNNILLQDGDFVKVFSIDPRIYNRVFLEGYVKYPGEYELKPGMKISHLLTQDQLLPEAYLERAEIERTEIPSLEMKIIPFGPKKLLEGDQTQDISLQQLDRIKILSEWREPESVQIIGEVKLPGRYTIQKGERLSSVLKRAGGFTSESFLKGAVFTRVSVKRAQEENIQKFIKTQEESLLREMSLSTMSSQEKAADRAQILNQQKELISLMASRVPLGRVAIRLDEPEKIEGSQNDIILENGDTLFIPKPPMTIYVDGAVNSPGAILWTKNKPVDYYLAMSGGLTKSADRKNIIIVKADGTALPLYYKPLIPESHLGSNESFVDFSTKKNVGLRTVEQGDTIFVFEEIKENRWQITKDIFTMFYQLALPVAVMMD
ncbi:MAG TPA: SLBB domain-containing protein [Candidatus Ratteibacteria bacterium]|nr:SLBB domain-containing protein [Candidatus Ratteibacteria bacterium]